MFISHRMDAIQYRSFAVELLSKQNENRIFYPFNWKKGLRLKVRREKTDSLDHLFRIWHVFSSLSTPIKWTLVASLMIWRLENRIFEVLQQFVQFSSKKKIEIWVTREIVYAAEINWVCVHQMKQNLQEISFENLTLIKNLYACVGCVWFYGGTEIIFDVARQESVLRREKKISSVRRSRHMETEPVNVTHVDPIPSEITSPFRSFWYIFVSVLCYVIYSGFYLYSHHSFVSACLCAQIQVHIAKYRIKINK